MKKILGFLRDFVANNVQQAHNSHEQEPKLKVLEETLEMALSRNYKIIAFDFDGTVYDGKLSRELLDALVDVLKSGRRLAVVTSGRQSHIEKNFITELIKHPRITALDLNSIDIYHSGGARGYNLGTGRVYYAIDFPEDARCQIAKLLKGDFEFLSDEPAWGDYLKQAKYPDSLDIDGNCTVSFDKYKITLSSFKNFSLIQQYQAYLKMLVTKYQLDLSVKASNIAVEIIPKEVSKALAVNDLVNRLEVKTEEILKIGDRGDKEGNDYEFLKDEGSISVDRYDSVNSNQVCIPLINGLRGSAATLWLLRVILERNIAPAKTKKDALKDIKNEINRILGFPAGETLTLEKLKELERHFNSLSAEEQNKFTEFFWHILNSIPSKQARIIRPALNYAVQQSVFVAAISNTLDVPVLFEQLPTGELKIIDTQQIDAGGKAVNVAQGLSRFGLNVHLCGFVGTGNAANKFRQFINKSSIKNMSLVKTKADTRISLFFLEKEGRFEIRYRSPGEAITLEETQAFCDCLSGLLDDAQQGQFFVTGGRIPAGCDYRIFTKAIAKAKERGLRVIFDFSATLTRDEMRAILKAKPYLIKPDLEEFARITGIDESLLRDDIHLLVREAKKISEEYGVEIVVVSIDKEGAVLVNENTVLWARPPRIRPLNTIGAGDALVAGLVYMFSLGAPLEEAIKFGVASGTATCLGAGIDMAGLEEIESLLNTIEVNRLEGNQFMPINTDYGLPDTQPQA
ncbi:MAG: HAD hydrolase family protein, partial [Candidatus Omnitrophica bacterium]|nr:HAD hydrolase family protein [Candidatus Omnitrophota bacterium]